MSKLTQREDISNFVNRENSCCPKFKFYPRHNCAIRFHHWQIHGQITYSRRSSTDALLTRSTQRDNQNVLSKYLILILLSSDPAEIRV